jgi:hypothetical protein
MLPPVTARTARRMIEVTALSALPDAPVVPDRRTRRPEPRHTTTTNPGGDRD